MFIIIVLVLLFVAIAVAFITTADKNDNKRPKKLLTEEEKQRINKEFAQWIAENKEKPHTQEPKKPVQFSPIISEEDAEKIKHLKEQNLSEVAKGIKGLKNPYGFDIISMDEFYNKVSSLDQRLARSVIEIDSFGDKMARLYWKSEYDNLKHQWYIELDHPERYTVGEELNIYTTQILFFSDGGVKKYVCKI